MFKFLRNKLLNKKWLNACLLLGIVLLVAVASCNPMFKNGAMDMTLASKFDSAIEDNNTYSAVVGRQGSCSTDNFPVRNGNNTRLANFYGHLSQYKRTYTIYTEFYPARNEYHDKCDTYSSLPPTPRYLRRTAIFAV